MSPARVAAEAQQAYKRRLEAELAREWGQGARDEAAGRPSRVRLTAEPIRRALRSARFTATDKAAIAPLACNGVWTRDRLVRKGVRICAERDPDTIFHRLYVCPMVRAERAAASTPRFLREARAAGPESLLYTRAWMRHPEEWPEPAARTEVVFQRRNDAGDMVREEDTSK